MLGTYAWASSFRHHNLYGPRQVLFGVRKYTLVITVVGRLERGNALFVCERELLGTQ